MGNFDENGNMISTNNFGRAKDFATVDLRDVSIILLRRGSRLTAEQVAQTKLPAGVTQQISILTVDDLDDLRAVPEHLMKEAGWVRGQ